jgi:ubiquinone/menaquinone biosynthesis C-methylase UbiE
MKDNFSSYSPGYAKYRPGYPPELFEYILGFVREKEMAWDCGTGNGQSAKILSQHFKKVIATDISQSQLDNAFKAANIQYAFEPAEQTSIEAASIDLITVAQAIHWFNFDRFYTEVRRVAKPGGILAVWTYSLLQVSPEIDDLISHQHFITLKDHWDPERKYVDEYYANIPFPFEEISTPVFNIRLRWSPEDLRGYLNTWSALQKFIRVNDHNPVDELMEKIAAVWGEDPLRNIIFPVHLRLGIIN